MVRPISVGGMVRPIAFAVLRLITIKYFVGNWTGSSDGFAQAQRLRAVARLRRKPNLHSWPGVDHALPCLARSTSPTRGSMAKARSIAVVALLLMGLSFFADSSRPEDNCLVAPNAKAPQGSSWHFHRDPLKQRKCWYLRTEGQATEQKLERPAAEKVPSVTAPAPHAEPDAQPPQAVPEVPAAFGGEPLPANTQDVGQAKAATDPAASHSPHPPTDSTGETTANTQTETTNQKQSVHAVDKLSDTVKRSVAEEDIQSTDRDIRHDKVPLAVLLGLGGGLVFVGMCFYNIVIEGRRAHEAQDAAFPESVPVTGAAETSSEVVRLLVPITGDLAGMRRSLEQLAAKQEQMVQKIATLQSAEQNVRGEISFSPVSFSPASSAAPSPPPPEAAPPDPQPSPTAAGPIA
jgi:hypothetical protein